MKDLDAPALFGPTDGGELKCSYANWLNEDRPLDQFVPLAAQAVGLDQGQFYYLLGVFGMN